MIKECHQAIMAKIDREKADKETVLKCPICYSYNIEPCGRGGYRCVKCGHTFGAD